MPIDRDDAEDVAGMLVSMGRAIPPSKWVDDLIEKAAEASLDSLF